MKRWKRLTPREKQAAVSLYAAGLSMRAVAARIGRHYGSLGYVIRKAIGWRNHHEASHRYAVDDAAFARLTPVTAYWAGFLMADGCVSKGSLIVDISERDTAHLTKLRRFLGATAPIKHRGTERYGPTSGATPSVKLKVSSPTIVNDLLRLGVGPRKTKTAAAPERLKNNRDFWRGMIDGDGHIRQRTGCPELSLTTGSTALRDQFMAYVRETIPGARIKASPHGAAAWRISTSGPTARILAKTLYWRSGAYLDRKRAIAKKIWIPKKGHKSLGEGFSGPSTTANQHANPND